MFNTVLINSIITSGHSPQCVQIDKTARSHTRDGARCRGRSLGRPLVSSHTAAPPRPPRPIVTPYVTQHDISEAAALSPSVEQKAADYTSDPMGFVTLLWPLVYSLKGGGWFYRIPRSERNRPFGPSLAPPPTPPPRLFIAPHSLLLHIYVSRSSEVSLRSSRVSDRRPGGLERRPLTQDRGLRDRRSPRMIRPGQLTASLRPTWKHA